MIEKNTHHPIYIRLESLCKKNNIKITPLCLEITGYRGNLDTWKKGNIRNDYLIKISEKFNVSTDYLLCKTDDPAQPGKSEEATITAKEKAIIDAYNSKPELQAAVDKLLEIKEETDTIKVFRAAYSKDRKEPEIVEMPRSKFERLGKVPRVTKEEDL